MKDHYAILEVERSATFKEIKLSYRRLSMKYHPDHTDGKTGDKFREIKEAYDVLRKVSSRDKYDNRSQHEARDYQKGLPINIDVYATHSEFRYGATKEVEVYVWCRCGCSSGTSANPECMHCRGYGLHTKLKKFKIVLPKGLKEGGSVLCANAGNAGDPNGDIICTFKADQSEDLIIDIHGNYMNLRDELRKCSSLSDFDTVIRRLADYEDRELIKNTVKYQHALQEHYAEVVKVAKDYKFNKVRKSRELDIGDKIALGMTSGLAVSIIVLCTKGLLEYFF